MKRHYQFEWRLHDRIEGVSSLSHNYETNVLVNDTAEQIQALSMGPVEDWDEDP